MAYRISIDTPALFIIAVGKDRLPSFQNDAIKQIACSAIDEARKSCGFLLFAYVIMPDHIHLLTDQPRKPSEVLQYVKELLGIV
jgi:REP element-mobilizing transposase RayT